MAQPEQVGSTRGAGLATSLAEFTRRMALELATECPELPGFPEVALRVRKALSDADIAIDDVVRIVGAEPSLSVRLLQIANSVALNPAAQRVTTLRTAIARIGFNMARSATIAFAMSQMRRADAWHGLEGHFRTIWEASARLAAMGYAVARHCGRGNADQALLAGMLHSVGKLFVLTRANRFPVLLADAAVREEIVSAWHARAGRVLLTQWNLPAELLQAACDFAEPAEHRAAGEGAMNDSSLCDVLLAARYLVNIRNPGDLAGAAFLGAAPFARLGLDEAGAEQVLAASDAEIASLRAALAD